MDLNIVWHQLRWNLPLWLVGLLTHWWPDNRWSMRLRGAMARPFIGRCGRNFQLGAHVTISDPDGLRVGDDVFIARGTWLQCMGGVELEDEVMLAPYVVLSTLQHVFQDGSARFGGSLARPVRVGRGSWLCAHVSVKCGVSIGRSVRVAANACVVEDTPDGVLVGGVPARVIGVNRDGKAEFHSRAEYHRFRRERVASRSV